MPLTFDISGAGLSPDAFPPALGQKARDAMEQLCRRTCAGSDFLGWLDLPDMAKDAITVIELAAADIRARCDVLLVIGIGGSFIGARSAIEFIKSPHYNQLTKDTPDIYFAGTNLDGDQLDDLIRLCEGREVCVNLVSKSGTTTETAVAFRSFEKLLHDRYGGDAGAHITCTCGEGPLKAYAIEKGYRLFSVPDDAGGRFSVLSPVGLLPMAVAGIDIRRVLAGAKKAKTGYFKEDLTDPARYAVCRHYLAGQGRPVELLATANPQLQSFGWWFQQLFAESEGKEGRGILPVPSVYTADLHSLGQFVQQGNPILFETIVRVAAGKSGTAVAPGGDFDKLSPLTGQTLDTLNRLVMQAVAEAHMAGGVPVLALTVPDRSEESFGALVFFFELACAVSSLMTGINPFDQPGVEDYKHHMKQLFAELP